MNPLRSSSLAFWLLLLPSLPGALWARWRALRLDEAIGDRYGTEGEGPPIRLLAAGDSIIAGVGVTSVEESLPVHLARALAAEGQTVCWHSHGTNGANISDLCGELETGLIDETPQVVLISIGVNDVTGLTSVRRWRKRLERMLRLISTRWPDSLIVFAGLPPMDQFPLLPQPLRTALGIRSAMLDRAARELLEKSPGVMHVPMATEPESPEQAMTFSEDGFHPDAAGCRLWADHLVAAMKNQSG